MSLIQPKDIEDGDEESIILFIVGLIRHYQPHHIRQRTPVSTQSFSKNPQWKTQPKITRSVSVCRPTDSTKTIKPTSKTIMQRIIGGHRPSSDMSRIIDNRGEDDSRTVIHQSLPRDIQEIHQQLNELKMLLSRPDSVCDSATSPNTSDAFCQTEQLDIASPERIHHRAGLVAQLQDQIHKLRSSLDSRNQLAESLAKELTALRGQQSRRSLEIEPTVLESFMTVLRAIRLNGTLDTTHLERFDEGMAILGSSLAQSLHRNQGDKTNIAIINPCLHHNTTIFTDLPSTSSPSRVPHIVQSPDEAEARHRSIGSDDQKLFSNETKMLIFIGDSTTPFLSTIPLASSLITLEQVKQHTHSIIPSRDRQYRYFFTTIDCNFGPAKQEIVRDEDIVPHVDDRIVVFIQQC